VKEEGEGQKEEEEEGEEASRGSGRSPLHGSSSGDDAYTVLTLAEITNSQSGDDIADEEEEEEEAEVGIKSLLIPSWLAAATPSSFVNVTTTRFC
jgi:hypothetical protein